MIKKLVAALLIAGVAYICWIFFDGFEPSGQLPPASSHYAGSGVNEVGAANLVTAVVVTYRGLDTVGEVTILFLAAVILGYFLRQQVKGDEEEASFKQEQSDETGSAVKSTSGSGTLGTPASGRERRGVSEIMNTAAGVLIPVVFLLGIYIFVNGHLTPGGGFQGGAVIASGTLLLLLAEPLRPVSHKLIKVIESFSGMAFVAIGLLGIVLAGGFLDNRILPTGTVGELLSAGAIPLIYSLIGLKVGAELSGILATFRSSHEGNQEIKT